MRRRKTWLAAILSAALALSMTTVPGAAELDGTEAVLSVEAGEALQDAAKEPEAPGELEDAGKAAEGAAEEPAAEEPAGGQTAEEPAEETGAEEPGTGELPAEEESVMTLAVSETAMDGNVAEMGGMAYESVQAAVDAAKATVATVTMTDDSSENVTIASGQDITLDLNGHELGAASASRSVITADNASLTLKDSAGGGTVTGSTKNGDGCGVCVTGTFTMDGGTVTGNDCSSSSAQKGGGVYVNGTFTMNGGEISDNSSRNGGGVYVEGTFYMNEGSITDNIDSRGSARGYGGGAYVDGTLVMTGGSITGNEANSGGGIYLLDESGQSVISGGSVSGNTGRTTAGGICVKNGTLTMSGSGNVSGNEASSTNSNGGGGIYMSADTVLKMAGGSVTGNEAHQGGGIMVMDGVTAEIEGGTISGNKADLKGSGSGSSCGGGIYINGASSSLRFSGGKIADNYAEYGGGIAITGSAAVVDGGEITGNGSGYFGGGVYLSSGTFELEGGAVCGNSATQGSDFCSNTGSSEYALMDPGEMTVSGYNGWFKDSSGEPYSGYGVGDKITMAFEGAGSGSGSAHLATGLAYTLSYDANAGEPEAFGDACTYKADPDSGVTLTVATDEPEREGCVFLGWSTDPDAETAGYQGGDSITLTADTTLYAVWGMPDVTLTYDLNGGTADSEWPDGLEGGDGIYSVSCSYGGSIEVKDGSGLSMDGCHFLEWQDENGKAVSGPFTITGDTVLTAVWEEHVYSGDAVTFNWDEDGGVSEATFTCTVCGEAETVECPEVAEETTTEAACESKGEVKRTATAEIASKDGTVTASESRTFETEALGHVYSNRKDGDGYLYVEFEWTEDAEVPSLNEIHCKATFTCTECGARTEEECEVRESDKDADCTHSGETDFMVTASMRSRGGTIVYAFDEKDYIVQEALGHNWGDPKFSWEEKDGEWTCTVTMTCERDGSHAVTEECGVTEEYVGPTCTEDGYTRYTAEAGLSYEGAEIGTVSDTMAVADEGTALGHIYSSDNVTFKWDEGYSACEAVFACTDCGYGESVVCGVTAVTTDPTCLEQGYTVHTARAATASRDSGFVTASDEKTDGYTDALGCEHDSSSVKFYWNPAHTSCVAVFECVCEECGGCSCEPAMAVCSVEQDSEEPTCTEPGYNRAVATASVGSRDGEVTASETWNEDIQAAGHSYEFLGWMEDENTGTWYAHFRCTACGDEQYAEGIEDSVTAEEAGHETEGREVHYVYAEFEGGTYWFTLPDTVIPAEGHEYAFTGWTAEDGVLYAEFECAGDGASQMVKADVTSETLAEASCTAEGLARYTAEAVFGGETFTVSWVKDIPASGHSWTWSEKITVSGDRTVTNVYFACAACGAEVEEDIIVETESEGVEVHTDVTWNDLMSADDLAGLFGQFDDGEVIDISLGIAALEEAPEADAGLVEELVDGTFEYAEIFYMDISLMLTVTHDGDVIVNEAVPETNEPVTFTVTIPGELAEADGNAYAVIRVHDGLAEVLDAVDNGDGTLTFESGMFSTYAIVKGYIEEEHEYELTEWLTDPDTGSVYAHFECVNGDSEKYVQAEVTSEVTTEPGCETDGETAYTATAEFEGEIYTEEWTQAVEALGHSYSLSGWLQDKSDDSWYAHFTCSACGDEQYAEGAVYDVEGEGPTCTEEGNMKHYVVARFEGETYWFDLPDTAIEANGHSYELTGWEFEDGALYAVFGCSEGDDVQYAEAVITSEATGEPSCESEGEITYTATAEFEGIEAVCSWTESVPATGHDWTFEGWDLSDGSVSGMFACGNCGEELAVEGETDEGVIAEEPSCTEDGEMTYTTTVTGPDGETYAYAQTESVPATGHDYELAGWDIDCDAGTAEAAFECTACGASETVPASVEREVTTEPGCETQGEMTCTAMAEGPGGDICETSWVEIVPASGHSYEFLGWIRDTEGDTWSARFRCAACGDEQYAEGAVYDVEGEGPTCTEEGNMKHYVVARFEGETYWFDLPDTAVEANGHSYELTGWEFEDGALYAVFACSEGDDEQHAEAAITSEATVEPSCEAEGEITYTATAAFEGAEAAVSWTEAIPATGHSWEFSGWDADSATGEITAVFTCRSCGSVTTATAEADGGTVTAEPSCEAEGETEYTATAQGPDGEAYVYTWTEAVPATGHDWSLSGWDINYEADTAKAVFVCGSCGSSGSMAAEVSSETAASPSCTEDGETVCTASVTFEGTGYGTTWTKAIPATGHGYEFLGWVQDDEGSWCARFRCTACGDEQHAEGTVYDVEDEGPTCTEEGSMKHYVVAGFEGGTYWFELPGTTVQAKGHEYAFSGWTFEDGRVSAEFSCVEGDSTKSVRAKVTSEVTKDPGCETAGEKACTAVAKFKGLEVTVSWEEAVPAAGHDWKFSCWEGSDGESVKALFECGSCGLTMAVEAVITSEETAGPTASEDGEATFTATATGPDGETYTASWTESIPATGGEDTGADDGTDIEDDDTGLEDEDADIENSDTDPEDEGTGPEDKEPGLGGEDADAGDGDEALDDGAENGASGISGAETSDGTASLPYLSMILAAGIAAIAAWARRRVLR